MKNHKIYEADDKMISLINDNYEILQSIGRFGINLGFGDKTVKEVCEAQNVDTNTFLFIVNFTVNNSNDWDDLDKLSIPTLLQYLKSSHVYYLDYELPTIRKELIAAVDPNDNLAKLIIKLFDEYAKTIAKHMSYEEKTVFSYVEVLLNGKTTDDYNIETFSKHHRQTEEQLGEIKDIIVKYLPTDTQRNNQLAAALFDIYNCEEWLTQHAKVEDYIFIPVIRNLEERIKQNGVSAKISNMISKNPEASDTLSDREKEVIIALVQGMANKEIADHLCISTNTVITHRRNIARKLQIHSPAGLTIYAIVNNLVDISSVKL
ncbi:LuxR C-terminal-related transcriptional regulator [Prevotella amnii]|jgi:hemerythrin HHE cation binding domain protein|nr:LuxR C-terminal-related transcriptional regulator [Prevotella amnii]EFN91218.1 hemerythrin HHE cation binding domain protein [Prevotella amnii CRIS 21A-A]KGF53437.1 LuxR family transcriptional regulator [Prevotella amnii DNF00058]